MSLHFECVLHCDLKPDTPQQVIDTLRYMTGSFDEFDDPPKAPFFQFDGWARPPRPDGWLDGRAWRTIFRGHDYSTPSDSGPIPYCPYFAGRPTVFFGQTWKNGVGQDLHFRHTLSVSIGMLDDGFYDTWPFLLSWLARHSETQGYVGYTREEMDLHPTLTYFREGHVYEHRVSADRTLMHTPVIGAGE